MRRFTMFVVCVAVLLASFGTPTTLVRAQSDQTLPPLADLTSVRVDYVSTFNGEPGIVCQEEFASGNRYHGTCHDLVTAQYPEIFVDLIAGRVREYVYYDGVSYDRVDDERTWVSSVDPNYDPTRTINGYLFSGYLEPGNAAVTRIGRSTINNTSTTQYQFWSLDPELNEASGGQFVYDVFVSDQGFVHKDQVSNRGSFPLGEGELAQIWVYSNFNQPVVVSPPTENVQPASSALTPSRPSRDLRWLR